MSERNINISGLSAGFTRRLRLVAALVLACFLSACLPSGEQDVNTELFKSKDDMQARSSTLRAGMNKKAVFETLGVRPEQFERMNMQDMQSCVYGNSQVQGTPEQLEQFRQRMQGYEGYALPYREIKSSSSLGFGKMKVEKTGYDLRLVLIFERDRLVKSSVEGTQEVKQREDRYMWDTLINRSIGLAF